MSISSITDHFVLDNKCAKRLIKIIENNKAHPIKRTFKSNKYEEGQKLLKQYFSHNNKNNE